MFSGQCLPGVEPCCRKTAPSAEGTGKDPLPTLHPTHRTQPYLLPGCTKHGLLDVRVHPAQGIVSSWNALEVTQSTVLVPHHLLHHGRVTSQFHRLGEERKGGKLKLLSQERG